MKLGQDTADVTLGGAIETDAFTIKASAKAFQILSSNLYSNPLGSMIRELSTNAFDAHIMVDKADEPFAIQLPNSLEPSFKIRDFGPGLSEQEIKTVYTTFFESTKTDSNDVVGCLGLGSKSPFGVADNFTINSFYNGEKTVYSCFLNEQRIPSIAKFHSEPTDEENGVEIEVAIKEEDINTFAREVNVQLKYFKVKPTVSGNSNFEWTADETYLYEGTNWKMVAQSHHYDNGPRVVQGQIAYPISTRDMGTIYDNASDAVRNLLTRSVLFEVPIGDVNIAPSREALSYDEATSLNIVKATEKVVEELPAMLAKAIQDAPSMWEARIKYNTVMDDLGGRGHYGSNALRQAVADSGEILWKKKDVSETDILMREDYATKITSFNRDYNGKFRRSNYYKYNDHYNKFKGKKKQDDQFWTIQAKDLKNYAIIYATADDKAVEGRSKQYASDNLGNYGTVVIIETEKSYQSIKRILGIPTLIKASDLPKVRRNKTTSTTKKTGPVKIPVQKFYPSWNKTYQWETHYEQDNLKSLEGYYIKLDRYEAEFENTTVEIKQYWEAAKQIGLVDEKAELYGLRKQNQKREHNLKCFFEHCKEELKNRNQKGGISYPSTHYVASKLDGQREVQELVDMIADNSPMKPFLEKLIEYKDVQKNNLYARRIMDLLGYNPEDKKEDITAITEPLQDLYPMIAEMGSYSINTRATAKYIAQMDALNVCVENGQVKSDLEEV